VDARWKNSIFIKDEDENLNSNPGGENRNQTRPVAIPS